MVSVARGSRATGSHCRYGAMSTDLKSTVEMSTMRVSPDETLHFDLKKMLVHCNIALFQPQDCPGPLVHLFHLMKRSTRIIGPRRHGFMVLGHPFRSPTNHHVYANIGALLAH